MRKNPMRVSNSIAKLLLATLSCAAQADVIEIQWDSSGRFERVVEVPPGKFAELCGKFSKGDRVAWSFTSDTPMNFNIHYHEGETVTYPVKQTATTAAEGSFEVSQPQEYCWMWSNKGTVSTPLNVILRR
jgi:hypothetical protein